MKWLKKSFASISNVSYHVRMGQKKPNTEKSQGFFGFMKRHKVLSVIGALAIIAGALTTIDYYHVYQDYRKRLTEKDYSAIEAMAKDVINEVGGGTTIDNKECSYERPGEFAELHLYCSIQMIAYMSYESSGNAFAIGRSLVEEASKRGEVVSSLDKFYAKPFDAQDVVVVNLVPPLPQLQCNFYIYTNGRAKDAVLFAPKRTEDNLIAISFECSAQSREEYFPVTYRQG